MAAFVSSFAGAWVRPVGRPVPTAASSPAARPSAAAPRRRRACTPTAHHDVSSEAGPPASLYEAYYPGPNLHHAPHIVLQRSGEDAVIVDMAEVALPDTHGGADPDAPDVGAYAAHYPADRLHVAPHITFDSSSGVGLEMKAVDVPVAPAVDPALVAYPAEHLHMAPHISLHDNALIKVQMRTVATDMEAADRPPFEPASYGKYGALNRAPFITFPPHGGADGSLGVRVAMEAVTGDGKLNAAPVITFDGTSRVGVSMPLIEGKAAETEAAIAAAAVTYTPAWRPTSKFAKSWV